MVAKLIPAFPYPRNRINYSTNYPKSYEDWETNFSTVMNSELIIDSGSDMDIFIYYRQQKDDIQGKDKIYSYDNMKTKNGTIHVVQSHNDRKIHGFDIIYDFLQDSISEKYKYILYQEDDISILPEVTNYGLESINLLKLHPVVAYSVVVDDPSLHMGGLFSLFPIEPLRKHLHEFPFMEQNNELEINKWLFKCIPAKLETIGKLPQYNNIPSNYKDVPIFHQNYVRKNWITDKKFLFNVGKQLE